MRSLKQSKKKSNINEVLKIIQPVNSDLIGVILSCRYFLLTIFIIKIFINYLRDNFKNVSQTINKIYDDIQQLPIKPQLSNFSRCTGLRKRVMIT